MNNIVPTHYTASQPKRPKSKRAYI